MTVVSQLEDGCYRSFTKGAPEMIATLCHKESIPLDYDEKVTWYSLNGYRVIAMAYKDTNKNTVDSKLCLRN